MMAARADMAVVEREEKGGAERCLGGRTDKNAMDWNMTPGLLVCNTRWGCLRSWKQKTLEAQAVLVGMISMRCSSPLHGERSGSWGTGSGAQRRAGGGRINVAVLGDS